ncbi:hypothetical protein FPOAC2_10384 [Fusarium poae]|jgi:hypothetical protein
MGGFDGSYVSDAEDGSRDRDSQGEVGEAVGTGAPAMCNATENWTLMQWTGQTSTYTPTS